MDYVNYKHRILVVGGTGFIGHHLLKESVRRGWSCTSVSLNPPIQHRKIVFANVLEIRENINQHCNAEF